MCTVTQRLGIPHEATTSRCKVLNFDLKKNKKYCDSNHSLAVAIWEVIFAVLFVDEEHGVLTLNSVASRGL